MCGSAFPKWISLGFEDTWNNGLFSVHNDSINIRDFCVDGDSNSHLIVQKGFYFYLRWNGVGWQGLSGAHITKIEFPDVITIILFKF